MYLCACVRVCVYVHACMCVCECAYEHTHTHTHSLTHIHVCMFARVRVCAYIPTYTHACLRTGAPVRGESVPVRLFLSGFDLTPTYRNVNNKFSVKYYLNLVLVDEEDRRYFKQQEITLWRKNVAAAGAAQ